MKKNTKILPLSIYNSFLKQKNVFSFEKICKGLGKILGKTGGGMKGFHGGGEEGEGLFQDYEENVTEEVCK